MLGVETIGNATLIAFDGEAILATDPWLAEEDEAYFGSWNLSHAIPKEQKDHIFAAKYLWFSHGHPDHLNPHSIEKFIKQEILLPDHVGGRIFNDLKARGYKVSLLPDRKWVPLSKNIKVLCISDYIQDAILLVDVAGTLFVNLNDAGLRWCKKFVRQIVAAYKETYLLKLSGYGDADMINIFDEEGQQLPPPFILAKPRVGEHLSSVAKMFGIRKVIPFSSFHTYQREDSYWVQKYTTPMEAFTDGFDSGQCEYIQPFVRIDVAKNQITPLLPEQLENKIYPPEKFGDSWSQELEIDDKATIDLYFQKKELLQKRFGFINVKVGGKIHRVNLSGPAHKGITFECPRESFMKAVNWEIFDDLLIGNFMKTTFHHIYSLFDPDFTLTVARFADNGHAQTQAEITKYLAEYKARAAGDWLLDVVEQKGIQTFRRYCSPRNPAYQFAKKAYYFVKQKR